MALKATLSKEEYEELEEAQQALYKEGRDGENWVLDLEGVDDHPHVKGLANTLSRYRDVAPDAKAAKAKLDELERLKEELDEVGDLDDVKAKLERLHDLEEGVKDGNEDLQKALESQKAALERQHSKELKKKETELEEKSSEIQSLTSFLESQVIERQLDDALDHIKVIPSLKPGAKAFLRERYRPRVEREVKENGEVDFKGIVSSDLGDATIPDFVEKWATEDEAAPYLPASGNAGTGSRTAESGGGHRVNPWKKDSWNLTKQGEIQQRNPALAKQLKEAAGAR